MANNNMNNNQFDGYRRNLEDYQVTPVQAVAPEIHNTPTYQNSMSSEASSGRGVGIAAFCVSMAAVLFTLMSIFLPFTIFDSRNSNVVNVKMILTIVSPLIALILSVVGLILSSVSKKLGFNGGLRGAAFGVSLSFLILDGIAFLIILSCVGCMGYLYQDTKKTQESIYNDAMDRNEDMYDNMLDHLFGT